MIVPYANRESCQTCDHLSEVELETVEAFFMNYRPRSSQVLKNDTLFLSESLLALFRGEETKLSQRSTLECCPEDGVFDSTTIFIRQTAYYAYHFQQLLRCGPVKLPLSLYNEKVTIRAWTCYMLRFGSKLCTLDSLSCILISKGLFDSSLTVRLCCIDSLFFLLDMTSKYFVTHFIAFLNDVIPLFLSDRFPVIRYFTLRHIEQILESEALTSCREENVQTLLLFTVARALNDFSASVRRLGLLLYRKLSFVTQPLACNLFHRKYVHSHMIPFLQRRRLNGSLVDNLLSIFEQDTKASLRNIGMEALHVAGALGQLIEDDCPLIRSEVVEVLQWMLGRFKDKECIDSILHCLLLLLYDPLKDVRDKALTICIQEINHFTITLHLLQKLLMLLLDNNIFFRHGVAYLLSRATIAEHCNLFIMFKYYFLAAKMFPDDVPMLLRSIEKLGSRNPLFIRHAIEKFPQLIRNGLCPKNQNSVQPNVLIVQQNPKLSLVMKFFMSTWDDYVIDRLPLSWVLLFHPQNTTFHTKLLSRSRKQYLKCHLETKSHLLSLLGYEIGYWGSQCLEEEKKAIFPPNPMMFSKAVNDYLLGQDRNRWNEPYWETISQFRKLIAYWLPMTISSVENEGISCMKQVSTKQEMVEYWKTSLVKLIIHLELFQSPLEITWRITYVLKQILNRYLADNIIVKSQSLSCEFLTAVNIYFYHWRNLKPVCYHLSLLSVQVSLIDDCSFTSCFLSGDFRGVYSACFNIHCLIGLVNWNNDWKDPLFLKLRLDSSTTGFTYQWRLDTCVLDRGRRLITVMKNCRILNIQASTTKAFYGLRQLNMRKGYHFVLLLSLFGKHRQQNTSFERKRFFKRGDRRRRFRLYTYPNNPRAEKALVAAKYVQVEVQIPKFEMGKDNKSQEFLKLFPLGKVPALETPQGPISESAAIAWYFGKLSPVVGLCGHTFYEECLVQQWLSFAEDAFTKHYPTLLYSYWMPNMFPYQEQEADKAKVQMKRYLDVLENHLLENTYLVGERVTLADITIVCYLVPLFRIALGESFRASYKCIMRWLNTCLSKKQFQQVFGSVEFCKEPLVSQKKVEAPSSHPTKSSPAVNGASTSGELMDMNEWKRKYSNTDTRSEALPWFWEHFNPSQCSLWYCKYRYNHELEKTFMSANLVSGWFQRLEPLRKYAFGSILLFGQSGAPGSVEIHGVWLFVGQDIPKDVQEGVDFDAYEFRKLDPQNPQDYALVENFFAWDGDFSSITDKPVNQGKVFK
eukprot:jgi/Galph1/119/GphlegSOOS_G4857.1